MTYNFDPERWLDNELAALDKQFKDGQLNEAEYLKCRDRLMERSNEMVDRLDGTYRVLGVLLVAALIFASIPTAMSQACPLTLSTSSVSIKGRSLMVEMATTSRARTCGLSKRESLKKGHGMLFVYEKPRKLAFWMKDTRIPLSIAFLDASGRIINIEIMSPDDGATRYLSGAAAKYALEVNQGWFRQHGIMPGDQVDMKATGIK